MEIELRKIQRIGSSSLVVTLPKEWAKRLGLLPGSRVMLIDEGESIRIKPLDGSTQNPIRLDLTKIPDKLAASVPLCIYLSPVSDAEVLFPSIESREDARTRQFNLMGLHMIDSLEDTSAKIEILLDQSRIDIPKLLKSLSVIVSKTTHLLLDALKGKAENVSEKNSVLRNQFLRTHYIVLRQLASRYSEKGGIENYQVTLSTSYSGFAIDLLQELVNMVDKLVNEPIPEEDAGKLENMINGIEKVGNLLFRVLASPSVSKLSELYQQLHIARKLSEDLMVNANSRAAAVIGGRLYDIIRLLMIASYVAVCRVIMGVSRQKK
ncbi:MAG: AbrB/MazE/SpoVT family DNA-binding domain-containing protein [Desulfurococcales archaeon]|nr:AbrB/MazE/SpoVT family DNA-binding domain-containing protein [Desulfurococcales archaeon]